MAPQWIVRSVHLNIGTGDSAAHYLVDVSNKGRVIESAVLVDGGFAAVGSEAIRNFLQGFNTYGVQFTRKDQLPVSVFDTLIVTHWDADHVGGIARLHSTALLEQIRELRKAGLLKGPEEVQPWIDWGHLKSEYSKYNALPNLPDRPSTRLVAPYWKASLSNTKNPSPIALPHADNLDAWYDQDHTKYYYMRVRVTFRWDNDDHDVYVPIAWMPNPNLPNFGATYLGWDLFAQVELPEERVNYAQAVSSYLNSLNQTRPVMLCVVSDSWLCGKPDWLKHRKDMLWYYRGNFDTTCVSKDNPGTGWTVLDFPLFYQLQTSDGVSDYSIKGDTSGNNAASIACMIIWPDPTDAVVTHYFAGDLGDAHEDIIVRWSMTPTNPQQADSRRNGINVGGMKLSHHGSKYSMPLPMLVSWTPVVLIASNGLNARYNHCSWETYLLAAKYASYFKHHHNLNVKLSSTNLPCYLCKWYDLIKGLTYEVHPGSIDSIVGTNNQPFWDLIRLLDNIPGNTVDDRANLLAEQDLDSRKVEVCILIEKLWTDLSAVSLDHYFSANALNGVNVEVAESKQALRLVGVNQGPSHPVNIPMIRFYGVDNATNAGSITLFNDPMTNDPNWDPYTKFALSLRQRLARFTPARNTGSDSKLTRSVRKPLNDKTSSNVTSQRRRKCPRGSAMPQDAVHLLARDNDLRERDGARQAASNYSHYLSNSFDSAPTRDQTQQRPHLREAALTRFSAPPLQPAHSLSQIRGFPWPKPPKPNRRRLNILAELLYFRANDSIVKNGVDIRSTMPQKDSDLDLFLGHLNTGSLVLSNAITEPPSFIPVDESDETCQFLFDAIGMREADGSHKDNYTFDVKVSSTNVTAVRFKTKLVAAGPPDKKSSAALFNEDIVFSSENNADTFAVLDQKKWPAIDDTAVDANVVGPGQVLCMTVQTNSPLSGTQIAGSEVLNMVQIKPSTAATLLATVSEMYLDTRSGSGNAIWIVPTAGSLSITLRLSFQSNMLSNEVIRTIQDLVQRAVKTFDLETTGCKFVVKKRWTRACMGLKLGPSDDEMAVISTYKITTTNLHLCMTIKTAMVFSEDSTSWILMFDPKEDLTTLLKFIADMFGVDIASTHPGNYLPNLGLDKIKLLRATFMVGPGPRKRISVAFQITFSTMRLRCQLGIGFGAGAPTTFAFSGGLFPALLANVHPDSFSFGQYMPDVEEYSLVPWVGSFEDGLDGAANLTKLYQTLTTTKTNSEGVKIGDAPIDLQLASLTFALGGDKISFTATVTSENPTAGDVPSIRLGMASLSLVYNYKAAENKVEEFTVNTMVYLESPVSNERAALMIALSYSNQAASSTFWRHPYSLPTPAQHVSDSNPGRWILSGSIAGMTGSILYSLCDKDCDLEMMQLLQHVSLNMSLVYQYGGPKASPSSFQAKGILEIGDFAFQYDYTHYGKSPPAGKASWTFTATASTVKPGGTLASVILSICGDEVKALMPPCIQNIGVVKSGSQNLGSFTLTKIGDDWMVLLLNLTLFDGSSVAFYQLQPISKTRTPGKQLPVKRLFLFSLASLPSVKDIPVVGELPQPFDEMAFCYLTGGTEGLTRDDVGILNGAMKDSSYIPIPFKDTFKDPGSKTDVLLRPGFHFIVKNDQKVLIDYAFGGPQRSAQGGPAPTWDSDQPVEKPASSPLAKRLGPVSITAVAVAFDLKLQQLSIIVSGGVKVGPLEMTLSGFAVRFRLDKPEATLRNILDAHISFNLDGLGVGFEKPPLVLAGYMEHQKTKQVEVFEGGATVGFKPWLVQAGGYYAIRRRDTPGQILSKRSKLAGLQIADENQFKCFLAFAKVSGPIATIGYAEIRDVMGGFGYNTSITMPTVNRITEFPFLSQSTPGKTSDALVSIRKSGWFADKEDTNWVAFGFTVLAFEMLTASAVIVVEWDTSVKLGIFGLATAEMPKQGDWKFARVQLGLAAVVDFGAGTMTIDGQLTPVSYVVDPNCRLSGGFAMYTWFGADNPRQGDWVFTLGGYHAMYKPPPQYPNPPRLAISWHYDDNISIRGEAYFAITPKVCMGGGRLEVTLSVGALYAYFRAYADFLINYKPFHYIADGGIAVGVKYTLDLWLVSIPISIELSASLHLEGPPMWGRVHVNFWVFGFDVNFGNPALDDQAEVSLQTFFDMVVQTKSSTATLPLNEKPTDNDTKKGSPLVFSCTTGLLPAGQADSQGSDDNQWTVRGAIFGFNIACKLPLTETNVVTTYATQHEPTETALYFKSDDSDTAMYAKPMRLTVPFQKSKLTLTISPNTKSKRYKEMTMETAPRPWDNFQPQSSNLPDALFGKYIEGEDPSRGGANQNNLLDGTVKVTKSLVTGLNVQAPKGCRANDKILPFDLEKAMRAPAGETTLAIPSKGSENWKPGKSRSYQAVKEAWDVGKANLKEAVDFWAALPAFQWKQGTVNDAFPQTLYNTMEEIWTAAPTVTVA